MIKKLLKWFIILWLAGMTGGIFLIVYFGWKWLKIWAIFYFKTLYLIIRLPIWLFIQLPLHYAKVGTEGVTHFFHNGLRNVEAHKKRYFLLFLGIAVVMFVLFGVELSFAIVNMILSSPIFLLQFIVIPGMVMFFISSVVVKTGHGIAKKGAGAAADKATLDNARKAKRAYDEGKKEYRDLQDPDATSRVEKGIETGLAAKQAYDMTVGEESVIPDDMINVISETPMIKRFVSFGSEAQGLAGSAAEEAAATGASATETAATGASVTETAASGVSSGVEILGMAGGWELVLVLLVVVLIAILGWIIMSIIVTAILIGYVTTYVPMVLGPIIAPILSGIGLGQAYAGWLGGDLADQYGPQVEFEMPAAMKTTFAKIGCALKGPQCLRQWRLNHTTRPGSNAVGQSYRLKISSFTVGSGTPLDIAYKSKEFALPVNFLVSNTRHGLKGIPARDVKYRLSVVDSGRGMENPYCTTGFQTLSTTMGDGNMILPGTAITPPVNSQNELTLKECEMLQPGAGEYRNVVLEIKYNYSSQATLYVDAMSRKHMRDKQIRPDFKKSYTADTPVKTYLNVKQPVQWYKDRDTGERKAIPFALRVGTSTDDDVRYRVHPNEFEVLDSSLTTNAENLGCRGLRRVSENKYKLSENATRRLRKRYNKGQWFSQSVSPTPARCTFKLSEPYDISPTGETLSMSVDANYTVIIEDREKSFKIQNTRCTRANCPILIPLESGELNLITKAKPNQWSNERRRDKYAKKKRAICSGVDAYGDGCSYYKNLKFGGPIKDPGNIESGELAFEAKESGSLVSRGNMLFSCHLQANPQQVPKVLAVDKEKLKKAFNHKVFAINKTGSGDFKVVDYSEVAARKLGITASENKDRLAPDKCENGKPKWKIKYDGQPKWFSAANLAKDIVLRSFGVSGTVNFALGTGGLVINAVT